MANFANLKAAINAVIKQNGQGEITGEVMNQVLTTMVNSLGDNYQFAGVATPSTNPGTPDQNVFYMATQAGTYTNFSAIVLQAGISILLWDGSWSSQTFFTIDAVPTAGSNNFVKSGGVQNELALGAVYDVSAKNPTAGPNNNGKWESLSALLSDANLSTLIPTAWRKGGMSIKFVQSSDNKYVKYRCMAQSFTTDVTQWQGVDDEPTAGSDNLVKSGGVVSWGEDKYGKYVENAGFVYVKLDASDHILCGIKADGNIYFGAGVPPQVVEYIQQKIDELPLGGYEDIVAFLDGLEEGEKTLQQLLDEKVDVEISKSLIDSQFAESQSVIDNPEFMQVETDSEKKILGGRRKNGRKFENLGIETQNCILDDDDIDTLNDAENKIALLLDAKNKVLSYRRKDGLLRENVGLSTPHVDTDELILSQEGIKKFFESTSKENILANSTWIGQNIWWCGTSIPAGASKNTKNERSYPRIVGEMLGVNKMYNEAVGSSCARRISNISGRTYESAGRMMGSSIEDALSIFSDLWTVNDVEHTVTVGPRTMGITEIPNISTYSDACYQRYFLLSNSYEIKLISKYLISDPIKNENFLREKFGNLYNTLMSLNPNDYNYQGDIDLFIIDHGHNDSPSPVSAEYINSTDITTYIGAINTYINLIWSYKPKARIMFVSDYDNFTLPTQTIQAQQQIAEHWHIPFIDLRKHLPFNINTKVKVRGYWATDGFWHETGFTYNPNASTVAEAFSVNGDAEFNYLLGNTIPEIAENITPEQDENGVWWYYLSPRDVWIKDAVHPSSDKSNKALQLYAKVLSEFIIQN